MKASHIIIVIITIITINNCFSDHSNEEKDYQNKLYEIRKKTQEVYDRYAPIANYKYDQNKSYIENIEELGAKFIEPQKTKRKEKFLEEFGYMKMIQDEKNKIEKNTPSIEMQTRMIQNQILGKNESTYGIWRPKMMEKAFRIMKMDCDLQSTITQSDFNQFKKELVVASHSLVNSQLTRSKNANPAKILDFIKNIDSILKEQHEGKNINQAYDELVDMYTPKHMKFNIVNVVVGKIIGLIIISLVVIYFIKKHCSIFFIKKHCSIFLNILKKLKLPQIMKLILSIMMFIAFIDVSYDYFPLFQIISLVFLIYLALDAKKQSQEVNFIVFIILALIFQPFFKVKLEKDLWEFIDFATCVFLLITLKTSSKLKKNELRE